MLKHRTRLNNLGLHILLCGGKKLTSLPFSFYSIHFFACFQFFCDQDKLSQKPAEVTRGILQ